MYGGSSDPMPALVGTAVQRDTNMSTCVHVYECVCMCVFMYVYACTYVSMFVCMDVHTILSLPRLVQPCRGTRTCRSACMFMSVCVCVCVCMCM